MSSLQKEHAKQLKAPDALQARLAGILAWLLKNSRVGLYALVPVVIAVGSFLGWRYFQTHQRNARIEELGKIQVVYEGEQRKVNDARQAIGKQIEALEAKAAAPAPADPTKPAPAAPALDPQVAIQKAMLEKQAEGIKADHTVSRGQYQEYFKKYEGQPEGWLAGMTAARLLIEEEKLTEAQPLIETVLAKSKDLPFYQIQSRFALMGLLEESGDFDKALAETDALEKLVDKEMQPKVLLARGRIQMLKNSKDDAKKTFSSLIENHSASPEAQKARSIQALLN